MAKIEPFQGIHYNSAIVEDVSKVICPPYDIIEADEQETFYQRNPYNIIRLILGKDFTGDTAQENKYTRAAGYLEDWLRRSVLVQDEESAIYVYEQVFILDGKKKRRLGFIALMRLQEEGESKTVHPHEHTHTAPKEDRLKLIKSVEANLSPIFTIFSDPAKEIKTFLEASIAKEKPLLEVSGDKGQEDRVWRVVQKAVIDKIRSFFADKDIFIADGHHRYEVAGAFRDYKRLQDPANFKDSYNYVMTYFTSLEEDGLCILPTHRLIKNAKFSLDMFSPYFSAKEIPSQALLFLEMKEKKDEVGIFGLYRDKKFYLLKLTDKRECNKLIQDGPKEYKNLDVVILHKVLFDQVLKITSSPIAYEVDLNRAVKLVDSAAYDALFILNPTKIEQIRTIALGGEVMPQKSTYFYPKLLSGFLVHKF
jgi:uncharacterized protein (DUF1015 family)